jgi:tellurite resistance protein TerC
VLFWRIVGALVMRAAIVFAGLSLLRRIDWVVYVFGGLLLFTAVRMIAARHDDIRPNRSLAIQFCKRCFPTTEGFRGSAFFIRGKGRLHATPLALALVVVKSTDLVFAVDSIPAAFAVTTDPLFILTANMFAVLGLRALFFTLAGMMARFRFLKMSLVFILAYVGVKLILSNHVHIPTRLLLAVIAGFGIVGILASLLYADTAPLRSPLERE